ncbi:leucine-rich repeat domain-containing protein [Aquimarina spongiae]|uniref:Leucine-rich repeat (LRR) protein n=1 Tax=Aquimarina spongiae TaxID=570521 RepID=A0A1M6B736_9FLAO|nr:hypothetical protein [Aquimarina spongiae]SHI44467.1 Leucine-rich repeat (LRR) protein [Aquimarina spongiae]
MKNTLFLLFFSILFVSCSSDDTEILQQQQEEEDDPIEVIAEGKQSFSIDFKEIIAKSLSNKTVDLVPDYALISINDSDGNEILSREKISIVEVDEKYVTEEITLDAGTYSLTEFIVVDANDVVISLAPKVNSALSQFIENSIPFDFTVETDESAIADVENIDAAGYVAFDFGYDDLDVMIPNATDSFSLTIDESSDFTPKTIVLKSITASNYVVDWGDGTVEDYVSTATDTTEENELTHTYTAVDVYEVTISGPLEVIEEFSFYSNTEEGNPYQSNITSADIEKLILLKKCHIYSGRLSGLNTSNNTVLEILELGYNEITSLDVNNNKNLKRAWLRHNQLTEFDVSQNLELEFLWVNGNQISNLDVSNNIALKKLFARDNGISNFDVSNSLELDDIDLSGNSISSIDLTKNTKLVEINIGANQLTEIDLSQNTELKRVDLYENQITNIDFSFNTKLRDIYIHDNLLNTLDVSNNPELERLIIRNNTISTLDISNNLKIFNLEITGNQFDAIEIDQMIAQIYDQAILNETMNGYVDFKNNPGFNAIAQSTIDQMNELQADYMWIFNNN